MSDMSEPLDVIAARIARIALGQAPSIGRVGPGPVLTVVRDTTSTKIYVGLNTGIPQNISDVLYKSILEQKARIWQGEVIVVRSDPQAVGGHSEVNALNPAIRDREKLLGRKLREIDLGVFELHNLWISGDRSMTTAARCEHCARITRGVTVTQSMFVAEGGVVGEINVPQRGSVIPADSGGNKPVTTTSGEINVPQRGSVTPAGSRGSKPVTTTSGSIGPPHGGAGGGFVGPMAEGLLTAAVVLAEPLIKQWFAKNYLQEKWSAEQRAMVIKAIELSAWRYNILIMSRMQNIQREKAAGHQVKLRVDVDTEWVDTDFGPAQIKAEVSYYTLLFEGDTMIEWPLFQKHYGFWAALFHAARITHRRNTYYIVL